MLEALNLEAAAGATGGLSVVASATYLFLLGLLLPFGVHRLVVLWRRLRLPRADTPRVWEGEWPRVTVQLPIYNEANVVERLVDAVCRLDYPLDRLDVQVLDDSTDETVRLAARRVRFWRREGRRIVHIRRRARIGYKAGALARGAALARGEFFLVLDADFVPPPDLLKRLLPALRDPRVGMAQAAWSYLNENAGWLSRAQALLLDAHFLVEHEARYRAGLFFNFNGTAGLWRRACLEEAGGWQADTLTEDLDLSYRAQLAGWRFVFLDELDVPSELPTDIRAVETQQERWTQGGVETARKLLGALWRSRYPARIKVEGTAHLLGHAVHPLTLSLGVALGVLGYTGAVRAWVPVWLHLVGLGAATLPFILFVWTAGSLRGLPARRLPRRTLEAMLLGIGLGVPLTVAVLRGLLRWPTPFRRTPKAGRRALRRYVARSGVLATGLRFALGALLGGAVVNLFVGGALASAPLTGLFAGGYLATTREAFRREPVDRKCGDQRNVDQ